MWQRTYVRRVRGDLAVRVGWIFEALVSAAILVFGIVVVLWPMDGDTQLLRADGLASIGLGLFGGLIAIIPFRGGQLWAWWALWFYPVFWTVHLIGGLPPGRDPLHQVVFIALSLAGLLLGRPCFRARGCAGGS
jgi:hypothetical protein